MTSCSAAVMVKTVMIIHCYYYYYCSWFIRECSNHGEDKKCIQILDGKLEWKRTLRRRKCRWSINSPIELELNRVLRSKLDSFGFI
jgi:hypothetical protein